MLSTLCYLVWFFLIIAWSQAEFIQPSSRTPLRPYSVNKDYTTDYSFSMFIPSAIPIQGYLEVEFPLPYQLPSACQAHLKIQDGPFTKYLCQKTTSSKYLINVGEIIPGEYQLVLEDIKNPSAYPASSNFKIRTYFNQEVLVDANEYFDAVPFLPTPILSDSASVQNLGYTNVNLGSKFDFTFTLNKGLKPGDSIKFNFPEGFYFVQPVCFHRNSGSYAPAETLFNNRMVICQNFQHEIPANVPQIVSIIGIVNPDHSGYFLGFSLETMEGLSPNIYENIIVPGPVKIDPGQIDVNVKSDSLLMAINTTHQFDMIFEDDVPATGEVWMKIPPGFRYLAPNCTLLRPLQPQLNGEVTCELAANKTGYIIRGFSGISASQLVSVLINAENPPVSSNYTIQIFSFSTEHQAKVDEAFVQIAIDTQYGSSRFFKSHALRFTRRLKHNETGPLEFTFFLNIPLPATTSTFEGKILIDIRPRIPYPPVGTLRCFFYNTVPADCTWNDTARPDRTTVTIFTPTTQPYFQTEIPITITTETDVGTFGIKLLELIQRYKFYIYFYRNGEQDFHEVYYEDYVPDPIDMPPDWFTYSFAPAQYGQESYLKFTWKNNYLALGNNYFVELAFDHRNNAWDFNLGWDPVQWYEKHELPCIGENLGSNVRCFLKPGGGAGTTSYIQMIGLSQMPFAQTFTLHFPKIKFGTADRAYMTFTLYENTPGENTLRIPILFTNIDFQPGPNSNLAAMTFTTLSLSRNQPYVNATLSMAFPSTGSPQFTIYQYPELFGLSTGLPNCGTQGRCYAFSDPVRWIVFEPNPPGQGGTTSTSLTIQTPPYEGQYPFSARTVSGGVVQNYNSRTLTLLPGQLRVTITSTKSPEINRNSILLFDVSFTTITYLPADSSVLLDFTGLTIPDRDNFYCQVTSGLVGMDARDVICQMVDSNTMRLNNLREIQAGTTVGLTFQLQTNTATNIVAQVGTYYDRFSTNRVDTGQGSQQLQFRFDNFLSSSIVNNRAGQIIRAGGVGIFNIQVTPTASYATASLVVTFNPGFDVTSQNDVLYCKINVERRRCTFTQNPLAVTIPLRRGTLIANTQVNVSISSDFSIMMTQGIKAPPTSGWHPVNIAVVMGSTEQEKIGDFIYVYPNSVPELKVEAVPATAGEFAMYTFTVKFKTALNSNMNSVIKGRIFIDFPVGPELFASDLGTGKKTGDYVGCNVQGLTTTSGIHCRLIRSQATGKPVSVEVIGFNQVPANTAVIIRVAKIKNPIQTLGEYVLAIRTDHFDLTSGQISPLEYTTYSLWHRLSNLTGAVPSFNAPQAVSFQAQSAAGQAQRALSISMYSGRQLTNGDYYVYDLGTDIVPDTTLTCPSGVSLCLSFPDVGWVVYQLSSNLAAQTNQDGTIRTISVPMRLSLTGYTITAYAWKANQLDNTITHKLDSSTYSTLTGNIGGKKITVDPDQLVKKRVNTEVFVEFTPSATIPNTGTIEIRFPASFTLHPNCKSAISAGSLLTSSTGRVACSVQATSWIITNFDQIIGQSPVKIYGLVDLPNASGTFNVEIRTYSNQDANIATNGQPIEVSTNGLNLSIVNRNTLNLDVSPTTLVNENIIARTGNNAPLIFDFRLENAQPKAGSTIELRLDTSGGGFTATLPIICYFKNLDTSALTTCTATSRTNNNVMTYSLVPSQDLAAKTNYQAVITTAFANNGNDGLAFPTTAQVYKAGLAVNPSTTGQERDITFFEIVPDEFSALTVKNYVITVSDENVIDIDLTTPASRPLNNNHRIVVELPTVFNNTALFDEDLGQGLLDGDDKKCDVILPTGFTMSCFFQRGNRNAGTPAAIILYSFSANSFTRLRFAFTVNNPAVSIPTVIPIAVYALTGTRTFTKTLYQYVEKAIVVVNSAATVSNNQEARPTIAPQTLGQTATLTINLQINSALATSDYYVIKTPAMATAATASLLPSVNIQNFGQAEVIVLPKTQFIIVRPIAQAARGTYAASIAGVFNPDRGLSVDENIFSAITTSFSALTGNKVNYASGQARTTLPNTPVVSLSNLNANRDSILTITVNSVFQGVQSLIIAVDNNRISLREDCYEGLNSQIQILQCSTDTNNELILITLENPVLSATSRPLIVRVPVRTGPAGAVGAFTYYLYSTVQTNPSVTAGQIYAASSSPGLTLTAVAPSGPRPTLVEFSYVPYSEDRNGIVSNDYGDLIVSATLGQTIQSGQEVRLSLSNFDISVGVQTMGDVTSGGGVIISSGNSNQLVPATILNNNEVRFTIPTGMTLRSGNPVSFRVTQIAKAGDNYGLQSQTTLTNQPQVQMSVSNNNQNQVEPSAQVVSFLTRNIKTATTDTAPIRLKFQLNANLASGGDITLQLPRNEYNYDTTSKPVCYLRTYSTVLDFTETPVTCTITGTVALGLTVTATSNNMLRQGTLYDLVVETNSTTRPYFDKLSANSRQSTATVSFASGNNVVAVANPDLYMYSSTPLISVSNFYYTTTYVNDPNTLIFEMTTSGAVAGFPTTLIEIELSSASSTIIKKGNTQTTRDLMCGVINLSKRTASQENLRCTIIPSSPPRVRIENYNAITSGVTFQVILYDLDNSVIAGDFINSFSARLIVTNTATGVQSQHLLTRMFQTQTGSASASTQSQAFPRATGTPIYGGTTTLTSTTVNWAPGDSCNPCRFIVRGLQTDWKFGGAANSFGFRVGTDNPNVLSDQVNNIFVVLQTNSGLVQNNAYQFSFRNIKVPQSYERNSGTIRIEYINNQVNKRNFELTGSPQTLRAAAASTTTTMTCTDFATTTPGQNGNVDCVVTVPLGTTAISAVTVDLPNPNGAEYADIYPYCDAFVASGSASALKGQLACSREDPSATNARFLITGFQNSLSSSISFILRAKAKLGTTLTANVALQGINQKTYYSIAEETGTILTISAGLTAQYTAVNSFNLHNYAVRKVRSGSTSPLRAILDVETALTNQGFITIALGANYSIPANIPLCTIRDQNSYGAPYLTQCTYNAGSNTYTLNLMNAIPVGRYIVEITTLQQNLATEGVTFPTNTRRTSLRAQVNSNAGTMVTADLTYLAPAGNAFQLFSVNPQRNKIQSSNSQFDINLQLPSSVPADTNTAENILVLEFPTPLYDSDLGASITFPADSITPSNGMLLPSYLTGIGGNGIASLHYGTTTEPALVVVSQHSGIPTIQSLVALAYIRNPGANMSMSIKASIVNYATREYFPTVLYETSYTYYFNTMAPINEIQPPITVSATNMVPFNQFSITISGKNYGTRVNPQSRVYIKLKNQAAGFEYVDMTGITCPGYDVEWLKAGYIFFLTPQSDQTTTPTIVCNGFVAGLNPDLIRIETGIHQEGYGRIANSSNTGPIGQKATTLSDTLDASRVLTNTVPNVGSVNLYQIRYDPKTFKIKTGTYFVIQIPPGLQVIPGRTEYTAIVGLKDKIAPGDIEAVNGILSPDGNITIEGYDLYNAQSDGSIIIQMYLRNIAAGDFRFSFIFYESNGNRIISSSFSQPITINPLPNPVVAGSFGPYLTDALDVYATEQYQIGFKLQVRNAISSTTSGQLVVVLPTGFPLASGSQLCRYSRDAGSHWIRSTRCIVTGSTVTVPMENGFDIQASDNVDLILTTDSVDTTVAGIVRPNTPQIQTFQIKSQQGNTVLESVFVPLVVYPLPVNTFPAWYNQGLNQDTIISVGFTVNIPILASDFFQLELVTNDDIGQVFPDDLGTGSTERRILGNCAREPYDMSIANSILINCYMTPGSGTARIMSKIVVFNQKDITQGKTTKVIIAGTQNPSQAIPGGFVFSVMRKCRDDGYGCPIYRRRYYNSFGNPVAVNPTPMSVPTLQSGKTFLLDTGVRTIFTLDLSPQVTNSDAIVIKTKLENMQLQSDCSTDVGICINFPALGWTFYQPPGNMGTGSKSITVTLDNGLFYDRDKKLDFEAEAWVGGSVTQLFNSDHPNYNVMIPNLLTNATQADPAIQRIVRNFDNILKLSMSNIWRTDKTRRIVVNIPNSYAPIADGYCMAGANMDNISNPTYFEFACQKTGPRQILIVINDTWLPPYEQYTVVVYYRGLLKVNATAGQMTSSTITSFADIDPSKNWVIDENTGYSFYVDPVPTPIIRDVNLNLKSFNDRLARISDFVEFYGAVWPYTPFNPYDTTSQIKQILFQVDDAFTYPSLSSLLCYMKVIYRQQVNCTLRRRQGRTEILVDMPLDYEHGPFLIRITNTEEKLLFKAPDREGSFPFNMTFLNGTGQMVEKADSEMEISGAFVANFSAQPILIDPLVKTLYDVEFTTTGRVTPQGFFEPGQSVSTQIVLFFQTYDPAFPIDLGSGLANNSEISCIPVQGITVTKTKKLTCRLILGTPIVHTMIIITDYDAISALSNVTIYLDQIATLDIAKTSRIKLEIHSTYVGSDDQFVFYNSLEVSPTEPTAVIFKSSTTLKVDRTGSIALKETSSYTFEFTTTSILMGNQDYIIIEFPEYGYEQDADYSNVLIQITSSSGSVNSNGYVMPKRNVIYIKPSTPLTVGRTVLSIQNLPNPSFILTGALSYTVKTVVNRKVFDVFTTNVTFNSSVCQLFANEQIRYNSNFARINENTYQVSFTVLHAIPESGSLAVIFDPNLYNLRPSDPRCLLVSGFSDKATCSFELFSQQLVRISMNGVMLEAGTNVTIYIINVNNPIDSTQAPLITIQSYFDSEFGTAKMICSKNITLPKLMPVNLVKCPIEIQPVINNADQTTDYLVSVFCSTSIRNATIVDITFPSSFEDRLPSDLSCSTNGNYMLQKCFQIARTTRVNILISKPDIQSPLVVRVKGVRNPTFPGQYGPFSVKLYQYQVQYADIDPARSIATVNIIPNDNFSEASNRLTLSVFPRNYGEKATYYFNLVGIQLRRTPTELVIKFDSAFSRDIGYSFECGTFMPQEQFGQSYALNYQDLQGLKSFPCSLIDDYVITMQLSPIVNLPVNQVQDFFFYIKNVVNPSLTQQASPALGYSFEFTFTAEQSAILFSSNRVPIEFGLPPSLLEITRVDSTDNNVLSPASYTLTFEAKDNLPLSSYSDSKDYELQVALPSKYYEIADQDIPISYSFPSNSYLEAGSSAFTSQNYIYIHADYPDLATSGPFQLTLSNITNPPIESQCGVNAAGLPIKFDTQYVSREEGFVFGRTYPIMDQGNCLLLGKAREAIKVVAPLYLRQGLVYTFSLQVEEPASDLTITPISNFIVFEPKSVSFVDYRDSKMDVKVSVSKFVPEGEYVIKWKKEESSKFIRYMEIEDTHVIVVAENTSPTITPVPNVRIENLRYIWTGRTPREVTVTLDQEPAEQLTLQVGTRVKDGKLQASQDGVVYSNFPISVEFGPGEKSKTFFIFADSGTKDNALTYSLAGSNAPAFDNNIPDTPFIVRSNQGPSSFQILTIQESAVTENAASFLISLSDPGTVFYMAVVKSTVVPTLGEIIIGQLANVDLSYYQAGNVQIERIQGGTSLSAFVNLVNLDAQTDYQIYFVARSVFGEYTEVNNIDLKTRKISEGASLLIPTLGNVDASDLIEALSIILPIAKDRLKFTGAEIYSSDSSNPASAVVGGVQLNGYRVVIAPDRYNNNPTPFEIAQSLLTPEKLAQLSTFIPEFYSQSNIRITPVKRGSPKFIVTPKVGNVDYYTLNIDAELINAGRLYAIVTDMSPIGNIKPTSYQIANGLTADNKKVGDGYFTKIITDENGNGRLIFDDLRDFSEYNVYVTAGNDVPYEPAELLEDDKVAQLTIRTLKNPNVGTMDEAISLYDSFYGLENYGEKVTGILTSLLVIFTLILYV